MSEIIPNQEGIVQDNSVLITNNQKKTEHGLYFVIDSKKQCAKTIIDVYSDIKQAEYHNKQLTREKGTQKND